MFTAKAHENVSRVQEFSSTARCTVSFVVELDACGFSCVVVECYLRHNTERGGRLAQFHGQRCASFAWDFPCNVGGAYLDYGVRGGDGMSDFFQVLCSVLT